MSLKSPPPIQVITQTTDSELKADVSEAGFWKIFYVVLCALLLVGLIVALYFVNKFRTEFVDPANCQVPVAPYGANPSTWTAPIESLACPKIVSDGAIAGPCIFTAISLEQATTICDADPVNCRAFVYKPGQEMWYANPDLGDQTPTAGFDYYIRNT